MDCLLSLQKKGFPTLQISHIAVGIDKVPEDLAAKFPQEWFDHLTWFRHCHRHAFGREDSLVHWSPLGFLVNAKQIKEVVDKAIADGVFAARECGINSWEDFLRLAKDHFRDVEDSTERHVFAQAKKFGKLKAEAEDKAKANRDPLMRVLRMGNPTQANT